MNFKHIMIVFKKEMKDAFRDKKSVITNILLPLVLIPVMYYCMSLFMNGATKEIEENMKISILSNENIERAEEFTKNNLIGEDKIEIVKYDENETKDALLNGDINCVIIYPDEFFANLNSGSSSSIKMEYNSLKTTSSMGMQILQAKIMELNTKLAYGKLQEINVNPDILNLINLETADVSVDINNGKEANEFLMMIIPMYLAIIIVTAGIPLAIDVIAGERERNTFEALLSTKANRLSILIGKYMAILVFSIIAVIMSFIGLIIGIALNPEMFSTGEEIMSLSTIIQAMNMPPAAIALVLLSSLTLAIVFAGIQIAISTMSKTVKEAQTYLSYMTFPAMILGFATMFMGARRYSRLYGINTYF